MSGQARFAWEHAIRGRRADVINGERVDRVLRVSLTFRGVRVDSAETVCNCEWNGLCDAKIVGGAVPDRLKNPNAVHAGMNRTSRK
ncbi:hypothetical protein HK100_010477 [Physocladia obscura]|uniref:Uncharacterized protein n=1 Tax=Physocladia obscura TaxID=109957 RepID=A0AAD5TBG5_9FUNG|nr:hypothetical protein HK100_010477 [Physocladia obscura]